MYRKAVQISVRDRNGTLRSPRNINGISPFELHMTGVVYVTYYQTKEHEISENVDGLKRFCAVPYHWGNSCGSFTYAYTEKISKAISHVGMPRISYKDPQLLISSMFAVAHINSQLHKRSSSSNFDAKK
ncbi:unnamed protein product [Thelazia callipaeda]|uniref:ULP_PROTEASE domain-containing protein n=1 Tax=Thelazia callipaeda TaxID=103827 RepID=A0A0N5D1J1_THECL|nr:unnamed protein product [Thelazia callipaeda]